MVGLILLLSYPVFLIVAMVFVAYKGVATTSADSIARWLLAISLAYAATFGLTVAAHIFGGPIYTYSYETLGYMGSLYWVRFWKESLGIALVLLIVSLILFGRSRLRHPFKKGAVTEEVSDVSLKQTAWMFTSIYVVTILLVLFLLIGPYSDAAANSAKVYAATHDRGLDPRDWFPFSWEWPGIFLYEVAFWVWSFTAFFLLPLVAAQVLTLKRIWQKLQGFERIVLTGSATSAALLSMFMLTLGGSILYWLAD